MLAQIAVGVGGGSQEWANNITQIWNRYVDLEYGIVGAQQDKEADMVAEYEKYRTLRPKIKVGKEGKLTVEGLKIK